MDITAETNDHQIAKVTTADTAMASHHTNIVSTMPTTPRICRHCGVTLAEAGYISTRGRCKRCADERQSTVNEAVRALARQIREEKLQAS